MVVVLIQVLIKYGTDPRKAVSIAKHRDIQDSIRTKIVQKARNLLVQTILKLKLRDLDYILGMQIS